MLQEPARSDNPAGLENLGCARWMGGRAVDGSGLENRQGATPRGFESHPIRQRTYFLVIFPLVRG